MPVAMGHTELTLGTYTAPTVSVQIWARGRGWTSVLQLGKESVI